MHLAWDVVWRMSVLGGVDISSPALSHCPSSCSALEVAAVSWCGCRREVASVLKPLLCVATLLQQLPRLLLLLLVWWVECKRFGASYAAVSLVCVALLASRWLWLVPAMCF
jgi:hypothetical protein